MQTRMLPNFQDILKNALKSKILNVSRLTLRNRNLATQIFFEIVTNTDANINCSFLASFAISTATNSTMALMFMLIGRYLYCSHILITIKGELRILAVNRDATKILCEDHKENTI